MDCVAVCGLGRHAFGFFKEKGTSYMWLRGLDNETSSLFGIWLVRSSLDIAPDQFNREPIGSMNPPGTVPRHFLSRLTF